MKCPFCDSQAIKVPEVFDKTGTIYFCDNEGCRMYEVKLACVKPPAAEQTDDDIQWN